MNVADNEYWKEIIKLFKATKVRRLTEGRKSPWENACGASYFIAEPKQHIPPKLGAFNTLLRLVFQKDEGEDYHRREPYTVWLHV